MREAKRRGNEERKKNRGIREGGEEKGEENSKEMTGRGGEKEKGEARRGKQEEQIRKDGGGSGA